MDSEPIKRIEVIIEALQLKTALDVIERAGATGYTVVPHVYGKGHRGMHADLGFSDVLKNVLVIVVARRSVADSIATNLAPILEGFTGFAVITAVERTIGSHFV